MKGLKYEPFFLFFFILTLVLADSGRANTLQKEVEKEGPQPIVIKSKTLEVNNVLKVVKFAGGVTAKSGDFLIECQEMLLYYENLPVQKEVGTVETRINKIIAAGRVKINRTQGGMATSEKAVYSQRDNTMVLTGRPVVEQGSDFVEGDQITIFLDENRSVVESFHGGQVKATIFPKSENR